MVFPGDRSRRSSEHGGSPATSPARGGANPPPAAAPTPTPVPPGTDGPNTGEFIIRQAAAAQEVAALQRELQLAFAPIHKRAFGVAVGTTSALLVACVTLVHVLLDPPDEINLSLLGNFFYGYTVTWPGIFVGAFWGFVVGFTGGWFAAFCRNLAIAVSVFLTRTRAELNETRDFLDHI